MFIHILKARFKVLFREKSIMFWGLVFPIFLSTFLFIETDSMPIEVDNYERESLILQEGICIGRTFLDQEEKLDGIIYFLAILAVACFIASFSGCREMEDCLSYLSPKAVRINIAPVSFKLFFITSLCATWLMANIFLTILIIYYKSILGFTLDGPLVGWIALIGLSTLCGTLVAMLIGTLNKLSISLKQAEIAIFSVGGAILAGLINEQIKFYTEAYLPMIAKINPSSIMVDGMFTLCREGINTHFYDCLQRLALFDSICFILLLVMIRRRRRG